MKNSVFASLGAGISVLAIVLIGVGITNANMNKTVSIEVIDGNKKMIMADLPLAPKKIVCLNYDSVDIIDKLGMGGRIVGMISGATTPAHLKKYSDNKNIVILGDMKNIDMKALAELDPDVILSSGRTAAKYADFIKIAPTMAVFVDSKDGFYNGVKTIAKKHGKLMGKEKELEAILADLDKEVNKLQTKHKGSTAIQAIFVGENLYIGGGKGATPPFITDLGFKNVATDFDSENKEITSYAYIAEKNPEYIFIVDKNEGVASESAFAKDVLSKNEILMQTDAFKNDKMIFLSPSNTWYLNNGGLSAMEMMLKNF